MLTIARVKVGFGGGYQCRVFKYFVPAKYLEPDEGGWVSYMPCQQQEVPMTPEEAASGQRNATITMIGQNGTLAGPAPKWVLRGVHAPHENTNLVGAMCHRQCDSEMRWCLRCGKIYKGYYAPFNKRLQDNKELQAKMIMIDDTNGVQTCMRMCLVRKCKTFSIRQLKPPLMGFACQTYLDELPKKAFFRKK